MKQIKKESMYRHGACAGARSICRLRKGVGRIPGGEQHQRDLREEGSGTRGAFVELFGIEEKDADGNKVDRTIPEAEITSSTSVMMTSVAEDLYSIGYISLGSLNETVKALPSTGAEASVENIKNESYKVSRPFNIVTKGAPKDSRRTSSPLS